jgi:hypothetical protein
MDVAGDQPNDRGRQHGEFLRAGCRRPAFFLSAWLPMIFAGIVGSDTGIRPFGYVTSMVVTTGCG